MKIFLIVENGVKKYFHTYCGLENNRNEIIEHALRYGFVNDDIDKITEARLVSDDEVKKTNKALYDVWFKERKIKITNGEEVGTIPPMIGTVQLD